MSAAEIFGTALQASFAGKLEEAEKGFSHAISADPNEPYYYVTRSETRGKLKNFSGALEDAEACIALHADHRKAHFLRGLVNFTPPLP